MKFNLTNPQDQVVIDAQSARQRLQSASRLHAYHWAIILASLVLSIVAWRYAQSNLDAQTQARFQREADQTVELVKERLRKYEDALQSGVAMINASENDVSFETWEEFAIGIRVEQKYPGINGIGVIHAIPKHSAPEFLRDQQKSRPDFHIHPEHNGSELFPISYIVPVKGNEKAVGLDMAHETNRFTAAKKSRDTGLPQITGPISLVQDKQKTPGFLFYAPFYKNGVHSDAHSRREDFVGLVYAPFVVNKLMQGVLEKDKRHVGIRLLDGETSLYDEHTDEEEDYDPDPLYKQVSKAELYGRTWTFDIWSTQSFRDASFSSQPLLILLGGILIDILLFTLFVSISRSSKAALRFADSMTRKVELKSEQLERSQELTARRANELEVSNRSFMEVNSKMRGIIDSSRTFVGVLSTSGILLEANRTALTAAGINAEDVIGVSFEKTPWWQHSEELQERLLQAIRTGASGKPDGFEASHPTPDGSVIYVDFSIKPVFDDNGEVLWLIPEGKDVTHHKSRQEELLRLNQEVTRSNKELEQFAYVASHDLQEPLRKVASYCELLQEEYGDQLDEEGNSYIHIAIDGAKRMRILVQDLLAFSKISSTDPVNHPKKLIDSTICYESAIFSLHSAIAESKACITPDELPELFVEERHLTQMFQNLIGNSIKYRGDKQPDIRVEAKQDANEWLFSVSDNGIGIAPEFHQRIFGIFKRLHNRQEYEGTGIGLAICQRIAERWNGKIWVDPEYDQGCKICFTIPKTEQPQSIKEPENVPASNG
jgi:PAS domain S-box-containing protein